MIAADLAAVGVDVDCLPVADVPVAGANAVIGDRAYGTTAEQVAALAGAAADGLLAGGVAHEINNPLGIIHALASDLRDMVKEEGSVPPEMVAVCPLASVTVPPPAEQSPPGGAQNPPEDHVKSPLSATDPLP